MLFCLLTISSTFRGTAQWWQQQGIQFQSGLLPWSVARSSWHFWLASVPGWAVSVPDWAAFVPGCLASVSDCWPASVPGWPASDVTINRKSRLPPCSGKKKFYKKGRVYQCFGSGYRQAKDVPKKGKNEDILCLKSSLLGWRLLVEHECP